jgi:hypothetical protein
VGARQIRNPEKNDRGLGNMFLPPASSASRARLARSATATTLHNCRFDDVAADCAAATSVSTVPGGKASGRYARTERWPSNAAIVSFHKTPSVCCAP